MLNNKRISALAIAAPVLFGGAIKLAFFVVLVAKLSYINKLTKPNPFFLTSFIIAIILCSCQLLLSRTDLYNSIRLITPIIITLVASMAIHSSMHKQFRLTLVKTFLALSIVDIFYSFISALITHGPPTSVSTRHIYKINTIFFPDTNYGAFFISISFLFFLGTKHKLYKYISLLGIILSMSVSVWVSSAIAMYIYKDKTFGKILILPLILLMAFASVILTAISGSVADTSKLIIFQKSIELISQYPFIGAGIGTFDSYIRWSAHTLVSQIAEFGIFGFLIPLIMLLPLMINSRNNQNLRAVLLFSIISGTLSFFPMSFIGLIAIIGLERK